MTYKEMLDKVHLTSSILSDNLEFTIIKKKHEDGYVEKSESRELTKQEIFCYFQAFLDYFLNRGHKQLNNYSEKKVYEFNVRNMTDGEYIKFKNKYNKGENNNAQ